MVTTMVVTIAIMSEPDLKFRWRCFKHYLWQCCVLISLGVKDWRCSCEIFKGPDVLPVAKPTLTRG